MVNQRFVEVHAPNQNLVGRTLELVQSGRRRDLYDRRHPRDHGGRRAGGEPGAVCVRVQPAGLVAGSRVRRAHRRRARVSPPTYGSIVNGIDSKRAIFGLRPLEDVVDGAFDQPKLDAAILTSFASAALALAGIGLYSLFMLVVSDRTREIAIRLAIGASPRAR